MGEGIVCQKNIPFVVLPFLYYCYCSHTTPLDECAEAATEFSVSLLQTLVIEEPKVISELHNLVDALAKVCICSYECLHSLLCPLFFTMYNFFQLASKPGSPESLQQLIEMVKNPAANGAALSASAAGKEDKARQSRDNKVIGYAVQLLFFMHFCFWISKTQIFICLIVKNRVLVCLQQAGKSQTV